MSSQVVPPPPLRRNSMNQKRPQTVKKSTQPVENGGTNTSSKPTSPP